MIAGACYRALAALVFCFISAVAGAAWAQDLTQPVLLVAAPQLRGPYSQTVLIALPAGGGRHIGFIINRVSHSSLASLFPEHEPSKKVTEPVYFGGPVAAGVVFAFVRSPQDPAVGTVRLFEDLFFAANTESVDRIIEQKPNDARFMLGYVGWVPGELASEITRGFWLVGEPHAELMFRKEVGALWKELIDREGGDAPAPRQNTTTLRVRWCESCAPSIVQ